MAVAFLLLVLIAQAAFLLVARETAGAAVDAAARSAARAGATAAAEEGLLLERVVAAVPGAVDPDTSIVIEDDFAVARVEFSWTPPGPDLFPVRIAVEGRAPLAVVP